MLDGSRIEAAKQLLHAGWLLRHATNRSAFRYLGARRRVGVNECMGACTHTHSQLRHESQHGRKKGKRGKVVWEVSVRQR